MKWTFLLFCALASCAGPAELPPQPAAPVAARQAEANPHAPARLVLPSGVTLVVHTNHAAPAVAAQLWVAAGAADERPDEIGAAHVLEHVLLQATEHRQAGEIERMITGTGGSLDAWSSLDNTVFSAAVASRYFGTAVDMLADAAKSAKIDGEAVKQQVNTIRDELHRTAGRPDRLLSEALFATAYSQHPYKRPAQGNDKRLGELSRDAVLRFYKREYTADRMVLVVVGDIEEAEARRIVEHAFAGTPHTTVAEPPRAVEPEQTEARVRVLSGDFAQARLALAWPIPAIVNPDIYALNVLAVVLGDGESSRLSARLIRDKHLVDDAYGFAFLARDPGLLVFGATCSAAQAKDAQEALLKEIERLRTEMISEAELRKAKLTVLSDAYFQKQGATAAARKLGFFAQAAGDSNFEGRFYLETERVSAQDVRRVAARYLSGTHLNAVALLPRGKADAIKADAIVAQARALDAGVSPAASLPAQGPAGVYSAKLPSGATLVVQEDHSVPTVSIAAVFAGGVRAEDKETNGSSALLARLLVRSTKRHNHDALTSALDNLAGRLDGFASYNVLGVRGDFLRSNFSEGLELFAEVLNQPGFTREDVDRERAVVLGEVRTRQDNGTAIAFDAFADALFAASPLRLPVKGTVETLSALRESDLLAAYQRLYPRERMVLAVVGDVRPEEVYGSCLRLFGQSQPTGDKLPQPAAETPLLAARRVDKVRERVQGQVVYGFRTVAVGSPDRAALEVAAQIFQARASVELKDKQALSKQVAAVSLGSADAGYAAVHASCDAEHADAVAAALRQIAGQLRDQPVSAQELDFAHRHLLGQHSLALQTDAARAAAFAIHLALGEGLDADIAYDSAVAAVSAEDVARVAKAYFVDDRAVTAVVKPPPPKLPASAPATASKP